MANPLLGGIMDDMEAFTEARKKENIEPIRRYQLVENTKALQLSDINKGWLPRISVYAQSTAQNEVPDFPDPLRNMISQNGQNIDGTAGDGHRSFRLIALPLAGLAAATCRLAALTYSKRS